MKRKMKFVFLCMIFTVGLLLAACGKNKPDSVQNPEVPKEEDSVQTLHVLVGSQYEYDWSDEYSQTLAHVAYPQIQLDSCCNQEWSELSKALTELNETKKTNLLAEYADFQEQARLDIEDDMERFLTYETEETISVRRADSKVLSLLYNGYTYCGGAHGMTYYQGHNFDAKTGKKLELSDVVTDVSVLPELIMKQFEKYEKAEELYPELDLNEYFTTYPEGFSWVLDYNGITFFFDPYAIGPYASGVQVATISYAEHPELVKEEYRKIPESFGVELSNYNPFYYDLDGDGSLDELRIGGSMDEYDTYQNHSITINGMNAEFETYSYVMDPMLIHTADGKNYLYIQDTSDNDWRTLNIYDVSDGYTEKVGIIDAGWHTMLLSEESLEQVLTDPDDFRLDTRTYALSTMSGYLNYHTGADGMPITDEKWYVIGREWYFTVLQPLDVELIDEMTGEKIGKTMLQAGDKVLYYRTSEELFADLKLSDGSVARVWVDQTGWPYCVDGIPIEELFDGIVFAG